MSRNTLGPHRSTFSVFSEEADSDTGHAGMSATTIRLNEELERRRLKDRTYDYMDPHWNSVPTSKKNRYATVGSMDPLEREQSTPFGVDSANFIGLSMENVAHAHQAENARFHRRAKQRAYRHWENSESDSEDMDEEQQNFLAEMIDLQGKLMEAMTDNPFDFPPVPKRKLGNSTPTGMIGFGITMIMYSLIQTGHYPLVAIVPSLMITFGGFMTFVAGILSYIQKNIFGFVHFISFSCFFMYQAAMWMLPAPRSNNYTVGCTMLLWSLYATVLGICTFRMNLALVLLYLTLVLKLFLMTGGFMIHHGATNINAIKTSGYVGVVCGCISLYVGYAQLINECYNRTIIPLGRFSDLKEFFSKKGKKERKPEDRSHTEPISEEVKTSPTSIHTAPVKQD